MSTAEETAILRTPSPNGIGPGLRKSDGTGIDALIAIKPGAHTRGTRRVASLSRCRPCAIAVLAWLYPQHDGSREQCLPHVHHRISNWWGPIQRRTLIIGDRSVLAAEVAGRSVFEELKVVRFGLGARRQAISDLTTCEADAAT